jgi:transposase
VLGYTIAAEIGESPASRRQEAVRLHRAVPAGVPSGGRVQRGPLAKNGPPYLRWALIEAATHAARHPCYRDHHQRTKQRLGRQRGARVARVEVARKLTEAIWYMLTRQQPFAPARPLPALRSPDDPCLNWTSRSLPSTWSSHQEARER